MHLLESGEMYIETIHVLSQKSNYVRAIDVGAEMGFSKPSVSRAMKLLKEGGYINIDSGGGITLTAEGQAVANKIYERHNVLSSFLQRIGVPEEIATEDACRIEHHISDETLQAIKKLNESLSYD